MTTHPVNQCEACGQAYVVGRMDDWRICRLCSVREAGLRNMIADEVRMIMDDYSETVINQIKNRVFDSPMNQ